MFVRIACLASFILFSAAAFAAPAPPAHVAGIYSDLYYSAEGGDLLGMELFILPGDNDQNTGYWVLVQLAEGPAPFTYLVPLKVNGNQIEFTLPHNALYDAAHFTGTFDRRGLVIRLQDGSTEHLKRGKSYWQ